MNESLVTARVAAEKKDAVTRILKDLGITPSKAINLLYDYVLENKALPFDESKDKAAYSWTEIQAALSELDSLCISADSPFNDMTNEEILARRAESRGLTWGDAQ